MTPHHTDIVIMTDDDDCDHGDDHGDDRGAVLVTAATRVTTMVNTNRKCVFTQRCKSCRLLGDRQTLPNSATPRPNSNYAGLS